MIEIYGKAECPFSWRARVAAHEKGLPFEWLPYDVDEPDPRALAGNPERKSPLLRDGSYALVESIAIAQYLDEAYPGPALQSRDPRARAQERVDEARLVKELVRLAELDPSDERVSDLDALWEALDDRLGASEWLGGDRCGLADVLAAPFVALLDAREDGPPPSLPRAQAWAARVLARASVRETRPGAQQGVGMHA